MTFKEILAQVIDWLQQDKRLSYRALKRQFALDDDYLDDLKAELIEARRVALDEDGRVLVWTGDTAPCGKPSVAVEPSAPAPHTYTPSYLAEKILTSAVRSKVSASRSRCSLPISKARWNSWPSATRRKRASSSIPCWSA